MLPTRRLTLWIPRAALAAVLLLALALVGCQGTDEFASEGTEGSPVPLLGATVWEGQVGPQPESSYYARTASIDTAYVVSLSSLVNDAILVVFQDSFAGTQLCVGLNLGSSAVSCTGTTSNPASSLYIRVLSYSDEGTDYLLNISP